MKCKRIRLFVSKGWTFIVCSLSVAVLALMGACRSKKVTDTVQETGNDDVLKESGILGRTGDNLSPTLALPGDSKAVLKMIEESNTLKDELSGRMRSVVYGPPEVMQRRAAENAVLRHKVDSLDTEINKSRQSRK